MSADDSDNNGHRLPDGDDGFPARIVVWGGGYVGLSAAMAFADAGIDVQVIDVDQARVDEINEGRVDSMPLFERWSGQQLLPLVDAGMITAATELSPGSDQDESLVHLIAVPTESSGIPRMEIIDDVLSRIDDSWGRLCIIESTITPGMGAELQRRYPGVRLAVAPRRDWFLGEGKDLKNLTRVVGGASPAIARDAVRVLSRVSDHIQVASNCDVAALTKCLENSLHHIRAMFACQVSRAFPDVDVNEAFDLAASHWRIGVQYFASAGTGGYCLPVSSHHLLTGASQPEVLSIAEDACLFEEEQRAFVIDRLQEEGSTFAVIGLAYRADVPSTVLSPALAVSQGLVRQGSKVQAHDPYLGPAAVAELTGAVPMDDLQGLGEVDVIVVGPGHAEYRDLFTEPDAWDTLRSGQLVFDLGGEFEDLRSRFHEHGIDYVRVGDPGWHRPRQRERRPAEFGHV